MPLASGLLTGKFTETSTFAEDDHRTFNRNGDAFNVGETFAGLEFAKGVELSRELQWIAEGRDTMAQAALRWILDQEEVSCIIPGFKNVSQVKQNLAALHTVPFTKAELERLEQFYQDRVQAYIRGVY